MVARGRGWRIRGSDEWVNVVERYKLLVISKKFITVTWYIKFKKMVFGLLDKSSVQESFAVSTKLHYCLLN